MTRIATTDWWGFRLGAPDLLLLKPTTRIEYISFGLIVATTLNFLWLAAILIFPLAPEFVILGRVKAGWGVPIAVTAFPLLIMILAPKAWLELLTISGWLQLAREQGSARRWDLAIALTSILGLVGAALRLSGYPRVSTVFITASLVLLMVGFLLFRKGELWGARRWKFELPDWLSGDGKGQAETPVAQPEKDARPIYDLIYGGRNFSVGIRADEQVLSLLRALNREADGRLYHDQTEAVVLVDRPPAEGIGQSELIRFCRQLSAIVEEFNLGKYEAANLILSFVQRAIPYFKDKDSTGQFEGGPFDEYGRFGVETIVDKAGDCECTSILCCSLLAYLGIDVALMHFDITDPDTGEKSGHAAVGLDIKNLLLTPDPDLDLFELRDDEKAVQARYMYGETATDDEISFGVVPGEWKEHITLRRIIPIPRPILVGAEE